jgi:membrane protein DedA with SNARE-associated domain
VWLILTFRFYYGVRNITPFAIGAAQIPRVRFFILNLIGAWVWAISFAFGGKLLGETFKLFIDDYHRYALVVLGVCVIGGFVLWATLLLRHRRRLRAREK